MVDENVDRRRASPLDPGRRHADAPRAVTERDRHRLSPVPGRRAQRRQEVRTFSTPTGELVRWADWLTAAGCTHVALESTGVYWRAIYNFLEGRCELSLT